jgi:ketosteroid isomerase-like protein
VVDAVDVANDSDRTDLRQAADAAADARCALAFIDGVTMTRILGTLCLAAVIVAPGASAQRTTASSAAGARDVRHARAEQNAALARRDIERAAAYWTEDVTVTAGLGRVLKGRSEYRSALERDTSMYERVPERVEVSSNANWPLAFETGTWASRPAGGGAPMVRGRYAAQWVRGGDRWLIRSEVFVALACSGAACERPALPAATSP